MTRNWLVELAPTVKTAEPMPVSEVSVASTAHLDDLVEKLALAEMLGKELAYKEPELVKEAAMPTGLLNMGKTVANKMIKTPGRALRMGGAAAGGALGMLRTPGIDPNTGQQRSRLGAGLVGAAAGYGAGSLAGRAPAIKSFVQQQGAGLKSSIQQAGEAAKAAKASAPAASVGASAIHPPAAGQQLSLNLNNPQPKRSLLNPSSWFKNAEALETNDGLVEHGPLTGTGKPAAPVAKGDGKIKKALAIPPGLIQGAKRLGGLALKHPAATGAIAGGALGAAAGGPEHRLSGAVTGAVAGGALGSVAKSKNIGGVFSKAPARTGTLPGVGTAAEANVSRTNITGPVTGSPKIAPAQTAATALDTPQNIQHLSRAQNPELHAPRPHFEGDSPADIAAEWGVNSPDHAAVVERYNRGSGIGTAPTQVARSGTLPGVGGTPSTGVTKSLKLPPGMAA
jgi:hypothetical protein